MVSRSRNKIIHSSDSLLARNKHSVNISLPVTYGSEYETLNKQGRCINNELNYKIPLLILYSIK